MGLFHNLITGTTRPEFGNSEHIEAIEAQKEWWDRKRRNCSGCRKFGRVCEKCELKWWLNPTKRG